MTEATGVAAAAKLFLGVWCPNKRPAPKIAGQDSSGAAAVCSPRLGRPPSQTGRSRDRAAGPWSPAPKPQPRKSTGIKRKYLH